jgi:hypothetical protein
MRTQFPGKQHQREKKNLLFFRRQKYILLFVVSSGHSAVAI